MQVSEADRSVGRTPQHVDVLALRRRTDDRTYRRRWLRALGIPCRPVRAAARRACRVVQEIFGVNGHIRSVCDAFAADGYRVVAPALFDRYERGVGAQLGLKTILTGP